MKTKIKILSLFAFALMLCGVSVQAQTVAPFMGLGNIAFTDQNGKPIPNGVLYSFRAGTTTQQATYTDATGLTLNPNPITMNGFGRAAIWLSVGATYKFVLCSQNDGPTCTAGHTIFSVDQVPGSPSNQQVGNSFTGIFSSATANSASTGILRLASGDTICWRNNANTGNLCISKDSNDILTWPSAIKLLEIGVPAGVVNYDILYADSASHRWNMVANNGSQQQVVGSGVDINTSDQVIKAHFGATALPFSPVAPSTGQYLYWDGSNISGVTFANPAACAPTSKGYAVTFSGGAWGCTEIVPPIFRKGTGVGDYSSASATFVNVDGTNLTATVTIPTGSSLVIQAKGQISAPAVGSSVTTFVAISDGGTPLNQILLQDSNGDPSQTPFGIDWVITGDGFSHTIALQFKKGGGSASNAIITNSGGIFPTMILTVQ